MRDWILYKMEEEGYIDGYLRSICNSMIALIQKDWDFVIIVDGKEGSGKSTLVMQLAKTLDPSFNLDRVVFNGVEFQKAVINATKGQAIVYDEGYSDLSSAAWMNQVQKDVIGMLTKIRKKNLFLFIVLPTFFKLKDTIAIFRSAALIHVYYINNKSKEILRERGYWALYDYNKKLLLYQRGKDLFSYSKKIVLPNKWGRFTRWFPLDKEAYEQKKDYYTELGMTPAAKRDSSKYIDRQELIKKLRQSGFTQEKIGEILDLTKARVSQLMKIDEVEP